jgi:ABC-type Fe3+/spermidine/putrescine transport system ATPase subunit
VTHDQESASMISDRIAVMQAGAIVQIGTPKEIYRNPVSRFVADFIGDMTFLPARVVAEPQAGLHAEVFGHRATPIAGGYAVGLAITLAARPEDIHLSAEPTPSSLCQGLLVNVHFIAGMFSYVIALPDGSTSSARMAEGLASFRPNDRVWLNAEPAAVRIMTD